MQLFVRRRAVLNESLPWDPLFPFLKYPKYSWSHFLFRRPRSFQLHRKAKKIKFWSLSIIIYDLFAAARE